MFHSSGQTHLDMVSSDRSSQKNSTLTSDDVNKLICNGSLAAAIILHL